MADQETKDTIQDTAIAVVNAQQRVVGAGLVGAGVATLGPVKSDKDTDLLQQIRDFGKKSVDALKNAVGVFKSLLTFEKNESRIAREQQAEKDKELKGKKTPIGPNLPAIKDEKDVAKLLGDKVGALAFLGNFLGNLPGAGLIKKILAPIGAFFGKDGFIFRIFGRFGPLAVLAGGIFLIARYADDIAKSFAPVIDKLKGLVTALTPFFQNKLLPFVDFVFKNLIQGLAEVMDFIINTITNIVEGIKKIFTSGERMEGLNQLLDGLMGVIFAIPIAIFNFLKPMFLGIVNHFEESFQNFTQGIRDFFSNLFSGIKSMFSEAFENLKINLKRDIDFIKTRFGEIFNAISNMFTSTVESVKNFFVSLPGKILDGVKSIFDPIINFFKNMKIGIFKIINAVIDALPMPGIIKDKLKFEIPEAPKAEFVNPEQPNFAKKDDTNEVSSFRNNIIKGVVQDESGNKNMMFNEEDALKKANALNEAFAIKGDFKQFTPIKTDDGFAVADVNNPFYENQLKGTPTEFEMANMPPKTIAKDIPMSETNAGTTFVNQPITKVDNSSSNSQTSINTGKLQVAVDPYHDRNAVQDYF